jgi:iron complex outermembrane receptor protein
MAIGAAGVSGEAAAQAAQPGALAAESAATNPGVASDPNILTEIVVTAQFRSASLQNTPIAITAVNAAMMEARNQSSLLDIASSAPNVNIRPSTSALGNAASIFIRGIGQYDPSFALEPGVGIYIDDVYFPTIYGSVFDLLDLDRVEILRGPEKTRSAARSSSTRRSRMVTTTATWKPATGISTRRTSGPGVISHWCRTGCSCVSPAFTSAAMVT